MWGVTAGFFFLVNVHRFAGASLAQEWMSAFQTTGIGLGALSSLYFYVHAAFQIPAGFLSDLWGPRRTLLASAAVSALGTWLFAAAPTLAVAYLGRCLIAVGAATVFVNTLKLQAEWYGAQRFATLSGLTLTAGNLGALAGGFPLAVAASAIGWRWPYASIGVLTLGLALLTARLIPDRPVDDPATRAMPPALSDLQEVFASRPLWPLLAAKMGGDGAFFGFLALWGVPFLVHVHGLSREQAAATVSLGVLGFMVGAPVVGWLSDRVLRERRRPLCWSFALGTTLWVALACTPAGRLTTPLLLLVVFFLGLVSGGWVLTLALAKESSQPERVGTALAWVNTGGVVGAAFAQVGLGYLLDLGWLGARADGSRVYSPETYRAAFTVRTLSLVLATGVSFLVREPPRAGPAATGPSTR